MGIFIPLIMPRRGLRLAVAIKPATLLPFHRALVKRRYRLRSSPRHCGKPGPKGSSAELIRAIVEIKQHDPRFGCLRIAFIIGNTFGRPIN